MVWPWMAYSIRLRLGHKDDVHVEADGDEP